MPQSIEDAITNDADQPKEVEADGVKTKQHPLPDLIEADRYLEGKKASKGSGLGIKRTIMRPPGAI